MLRELSINNFVVVEQQSVEFGSGFNVISGESGAGKSVLLSALEFVLGARTGPQVIRPGNESANVQALFELNNSSSIVNVLPDEIRDDLKDQLILSRSITSTGRNKAYINGKIITISQLEEVGKHLVTISSQSEHLKLLDVKFHREIVDAFAENQAILTDYKRTFTKWSELKTRIEAIEEQLKHSVLRRAELENIVEELTNVKPHAGLRSELEENVKRLSSSEHIISTGQAITLELNAEGGVLDSMRSITTRAHELVKHDNKASPILELLTSARAEAEEALSDLRHYIGTISTDDAALEKAREALAEIARVERKYRTNDAGLEILLEKANEELLVINTPSTLETLKSELTLLTNELQTIADKLSETRRKAAKELSKRVVDEFIDLGLKDAKIKLEIGKAELAYYGQDEIEILLSPAKDADYRALKSIASGGEVSRIFLAFKKILGSRSGTPVVVFDEIDTGVSGKTARAVGQKLRELSEAVQVISVTHLAQVASLSDHHFTVSKADGNSAAKRNMSVISEVNGDQKIEEIARMLSGYKVTHASRESARELLSSKT